MERERMRQSSGAIILLVAEEQAVALDVELQLQLFGCHAHWVTTGEEAIELMKKLHPHLLLVDIDPAGAMYGPRAGAIIRERHGIPVLFLTTAAELVTGETGIESDPCSYVLKPCRSRELELAIEMALYRSRMNLLLDEALHQAELKRATLEAIVAGIGVGLCVLDTEFRIFYQNPLHRVITNGDKVGTYCFASIRNRDQPCEECPMKRCFETGRVDTTEREYHNGELLQFLEITTSPITNSRGVIIAGVELVKEITTRKESELALQESEERHRELANYDTLTGLPNRRFFDDRLHQALAQARRFDRQVAILFIDLDHFKPINDRLGHAAGDDLLKKVALRLRDCCPRESETVARIGGDEFIILLPELREQSEATSMAARLIRRFSEKFSIESEELTINLSIGISLYPQDGTDAKILLKHADTALYRAKREGRNTWRRDSQIS